MLFRTENRLNYYYSIDDVFNSKSMRVNSFSLAFKSIGLKIDGQVIDG